MTTEVTAETTIVGVSVYPDRARVTRRGNAELHAGSNRLIISDLPLTLESDSVRVSGRGSGQVRIGGVDVQQRHFEETPAQRVQALEAEIEAGEDELRSLHERQATLAAQRSMLDGLRGATTEYARGLSRGRMTIEDQERLLDFLQEQDAKLRAANLSLEGEAREVSRRLDRQKRELKALQSQRARVRYEVRVDVEADEAEAFEVSVSYVVGQAGWRPLYDLRLLPDGEGQLLELTSQAQVTQNSGEDWLGVALNLSTARPALNQRLPDLQPWYVDVMRPLAETGAPEARMLMAAAPAHKELHEADHLVATAREGAMAVSFDAPGRSDIPSDGSPHKALLGRYQLSPRIDYVTVPRHTAAVYRRVTVENTTPAPWLPGAAALFAGDEYIGRTQIEMTPRGGEVELLLGVEERIIVERELIRRQVDKQLLRDRRQLHIGYEIRLENCLPVTARIEARDQIPVSRHEEIRIKLERVEPAPTEQSDLNILEWQLTLEPSEKRTIHYQYLVEHPRALQVAGLLD